MESIKHCLGYVACIIVIVVMALAASMHRALHDDPYED